MTVTTAQWWLIFVAAYIAIVAAYVIGHWMGGKSAHHSAREAREVYEQIEPIASSQRELPPPSKKVLWILCPECLRGQSTEVESTPGSFVEIMEMPLFIRREWSS